MRNRPKPEQRRKGDRQPDYGLRRLEVSGCQENAAVAYGAKTTEQHFGHKQWRPPNQVIHGANRIANISMVAFRQQLANLFPTNILDQAQHVTARRSIFTFVK